MKKIKLLGIMIILVLLAFLTYSCGLFEEQVTTTTTTIATTTTTTSTTTTTAGPAAGYSIYSGQDPSGQGFSFEYPDGWTVSEEALTSDWNTGAWIMFKGPGDWQTGRPVLSLWIVSAAGSLTDRASYNSAAYSDRNVSAGDGTGGPGLIAESSSTETVAGLTAEGWRIIFRSRLPLGRIHTTGGIDYSVLMGGGLITAESEWVVFQQGNYIYDLNFAAIGDSLTARDEYRHAKATFQFN